MATMDNTLRSFEGEDLLREQKVLEMLCGPILETTNSGIIQFVHFTAKESAPAFNPWAFTNVVLGIWWEKIQSLMCESRWQKTPVLFCA